MSSTFSPPRPLNTAVLFLVFNRAETTKEVFKAIRKAKPPRLYVAADGPRDGKEEEVKRVDEVRKIATNVDWDCETYTLFREENLGCKRAVSGAIDWFFEYEEMGIILEDDCLPSLSFFNFCEDLLEKYKYDNRIFIVSGYNKQNKWNPEKYDYFFSNLGGIWGWASWRRAWRYYDSDMTDLNEFIEEGYLNQLFDRKTAEIRGKNLLNAPTSSWAYPWGFARHLNSGLACVPSKSLITNIGFGEQATHTTRKIDDINLHELSLPIKNNKFVVADNEYDRLFLRKKSTIERVIRKLSFVKNKLK